MEVASHPHDRTQDFLGRGGCTKTQENPGIAKKGGGLTPAKICLVDLT